MKERQLSAKDKAFEKERVKFRQELRRCEREIKTRDDAICELRSSIEDKDKKIQEQEKRISELLALIDRPADEIEYLLSKRDVVTAMQDLSDAVNSMGRIFYR